ncbi:MAG: MarR family transcriptional regulator [Erysipelotrichaceae bacterium]|nr:MarR family transcriptional regulator [Erysipelotrichaceae bacterium]MDP3305871.1 MarR family transcriptional regulator [Erysipelotrichaceae bacterium]
MNPTFQKDTVYQLMKAAKLLRNRLDAALREHDITSSQFSVLNIIHQSNTQPTSSEIAYILSSDRPTISGILLRLEQKGMIIRSENPLDRREEKISLTEKSQSDMSSVINKTDQIGEEVERLIKGSEQKDFNQILFNMIETFEKDDIK